MNLPGRLILLIEDADGFNRYVDEPNSKYSCYDLLHNLSGRLDNLPNHPEPAAPYHSNNQRIQPSAFPFRMLIAFTNRLDSDRLSATKNLAGTRPVYVRLADYMSKWNLWGKMQMRHRKQILWRIGGTASGVEPN